MKLQKKTSLESTENVKDTLEWKLQSIKVANLPTETALADYIAFSIDNLNNKISYIQVAKKEFEDEIKEVNNQIEYIKTEGAKFLQDAGIERLEGIICSSVTITKGRQEEETETKKAVFTPLISEAEIEEFLIKQGKAEMRVVTETKITKFIAPKLKINSKRK